MGFPLPHLEPAPSDQPRRLAARLTSDPGPVPKQITIWEGFEERSNTALRSFAFASSSPGGCGLNRAGAATACAPFAGGLSRPALDLASRPSSNRSSKNSVEKALHSASHSELKLGFN